MQHAQHQSNSLLFLWCNTQHQNTQVPQPWTDTGAEATHHAKFVTMCVWLHHDQAAIEAIFHQIIFNTYAGACTAVRRYMNNPNWMGENEQDWLGQSRNKGIIEHGSTTSRVHPTQNKTKPARSPPCQCTYMNAYIHKCALKLLNI
jgi:hypothetical protein